MISDDDREAEIGHWCMAQSRGELIQYRALLSYQGPAVIRRPASDGSSTLESEDEVLELVYVCQTFKMLFQDGEIARPLLVVGTLLPSSLQNASGARLYDSGADMDDAFTTFDVPFDKVVAIGTDDDPLCLPAGASMESFWHDPSALGGVNLIELAEEDGLVPDDEKADSDEDLRDLLYAYLFDADPCSQLVPITQACSRAGLPTIGPSPGARRDRSAIKLERSDSQLRRGARTRFLTERFSPDRDVGSEFEAAASQLAREGHAGPFASPGRSLYSAPPLPPRTPSGVPPRRSSTPSAKAPSVPIDRSIRGPTSGEMRSAALGALPDIAKRVAGARDQDTSGRTLGIREKLARSKSSSDRNASAGAGLRQNTDDFIRNDNTKKEELRAMESGVAMRGGRGEDTFECAEGCCQKFPAKFCKKHGLPFVLRLDSSASANLGSCSACGALGIIGASCAGCHEGIFEAGAGSCPVGGCVERGAAGSHCPEHGCPMAPSEEDELSPGGGNGSPPLAPLSHSGLGALAPAHAPSRPTAPTAATRHTAPPPTVQPLPTAELALGAMLWGDRVETLKKPRSTSMLELQDTMDICESFDPEYYGLVTKHLTENPIKGLSLRYFNVNSILNAKNKISIGNGMEVLSTFKGADGRDVEMRRKGQELKIQSECPTTLIELITAFIGMKQVLIGMQGLDPLNLGFEFLKFDLMLSQLMADYQLCRTSHTAWSEAAVCAHVVTTWDRFLRYVRASGCDVTDRKAAFYIFKDFETECSTALVAKGGAAVVNPRPTVASVDGALMGLDDRAVIDRSKLSNGAKLEVFAAPDAMAKGVRWPGDNCGLCFHFHVLDNCFYKKAGSCQWIHEDKKTGKLCPQCKGDHPLVKCPNLDNWNAQNAKYKHFKFAHQNAGNSK